MSFRALIVDDEPGIVSTLREILESRGFAAQTATSARTARLALSSAVFDVVITDLKMETATAGLEVVEAATRLSPRPVTVIMSAHPQLLDSWKDRGAHAFFEKPADVSDLLQTIDDLLRARDNGAAA